MKTKSTLEKAVKFVTNCKFIFLSKKNIFQKTFFLLLCFLIATTPFLKTKNANMLFNSSEDIGQDSKLFSQKKISDLHFSSGISFQNDRASSSYLLLFSSDSSKSILF
ncbi:hypothetical protein [Flavobacterium ustbae]|uniref:hypothetical protein n=1 Tax=Flavobacterium ustbae TaxID=2488790 RepID=UPI000F7A6E3C|nr:hypothetical protein [Flavobacterium ustbae]